MQKRIYSFHFECRRCWLQASRHLSEKSSATMGVLYVAMLLCIFYPFQLFSQTHITKKLSAEASMFSRAEHALKKHDELNYQTLRSKLQSYPLYPYLIYQELRQRIEEKKTPTVQLKEITEFHDKYPDFPFHHVLRNLWLTQMAQNQNWDALVQGYKPSKKVALECQYYFGKYQLTQNKNDLAPVKQLWLVGYSQPSECEPVFSLWKKTGGFTPDLIWDRFRLALENKNFILIQHLLKQLPPAQKDAATLMENLIKNPELINNPDTLKNIDTIANKVKNKVSNVDILMLVLPVLGAFNAEHAAQWWKLHEKDYPFSKEQINQIYRNIATLLARQKSPLANEWLSTLPQGAIDTATQEWKIRVSLSHLDWENVLKGINKLPPYIREEKCWRYWQARALEKLNNYPQAEILYKQLAQTRSYYGFLSAMHLKKPFALQNRGIPYDPEATKKILNIPAIKRFEELLLLDKDHLARYEWFRAVEKMNDRELNAAAKIAQKMNLPDYAIITTLKGSHRDDVPLRFPFVHHSEIIHYATQNKIDPAWAFAIPRQESSFFSGTVSSAGAKGLMQLMPNTAAMLAKRYNIPYTSEEALHDPLINIQLGTIYLRDLQQRMYDNYILATAAYNAGPSRVRQWIPTEAMDADIWVDNIPFKETREYVKNVFMFTGIYRQQLGLPSTMEFMMKPIPAKVKAENTVKS